MVPNISMIISSILLSLAISPALGQVSQSSCNPAGVTGSCAEFISTFCADVATASFRPFDNGSRCFGKNGFRCDLTAYNTNSTYNGPPSQTNCGLVLNSITKTCPMGGGAKILPTVPFMFSIDPNQGACSSGVQAGS
ncbi:hypothetical protein B0H34DRAFT_738120 [Crassisporium funariophilum]|nr:hypothetical protein B0H34DRAFT_738120 [Crassisporium funariophilum]